MSPSRSTDTDKRLVASNLLILCKNVVYGVIVSELSKKSLYSTWATNKKCVTVLFRQSGCFWYVEKNDKGSEISTTKFCVEEGSLTG